MRYNPLSERVLQKFQMIRVYVIIKISQRILLFCRRPGVTKVHFFLNSERR